jgi:hypothetical protein
LSTSSWTAASWSLWFPLQANSSTSCPTSMTIRPRTYMSSMQSGATMKTPTAEHHQQRSTVSSGGWTPIICRVRFFLYTELDHHSCIWLKKRRGIVQGTFARCNSLLFQGWYLSPSWDSIIKYFWFTLSCFNGYHFLHSYTQT